MGLTEEEAIELYGHEAVDCYVAEFDPLEWTLVHRHAEEGEVCYIKTVVNRLDNGRVLGMHIAAPNAGEIIQGFALAFRKGITHKVRDPLPLPPLCLILYSVTLSKLCCLPLFISLSAITTLLPLQKCPNRYDYNFFCAVVIPDRTYSIQSGCTLR